MPATFDIPDKTLVIHAEREKPIRISPGSGAVWVDDERITTPVVVRHAARVTGYGTVSTAEVEPEPKKPPRAKRPSEVKAAESKAAENKAPAPKPKSQTSTAKAKVTKKGKK
jgi:hypothetical protein